MFNEILKYTRTFQRLSPTFQPSEENINFARVDIRPSMKKYAQNEGILTQPGRNLISSFFLENVTIITPLLLFYLDYGLVCEKIYRFVHYTPMKCFSKIVHSAVNARREVDENLNSSVVAETMKLLANNSFGYQIMDRSRYTETKYLSDETTHEAINNKMFKRLGYINDQLREVELVKSEVEHIEPIIVGLFILQYPQLRMVQLYYNLYDKYCHVTKFDELDMGGDLLYLALSDHDLYYCMRPGMKKERKFCEVETARKNIQPTEHQLYSLLLVALSKGSTIDENLAYLKKNSAAKKWFVCVAKHIAVKTHNQSNSKVSGKAWIRQRLRTVVMAVCPNIAKFWKRLLM